MEWKKRGGKSPDCPRKGESCSGYSATGEGAAAARRYRKRRFPTRWGGENTSEGKEITFILRRAGLGGCHRSKICSTRGINL